MWQKRRQVGPWELMAFTAIAIFVFAIFYVHNNGGLQQSFDKAAEAFAYLWDH